MRNLHQIASGALVLIRKGWLILLYLGGITLAMEVVMGLIL
jgi:hypothetical protein